MSDRTETYDVDSDVSVVINIHRGDIRFKKGEPGRVVLRLSGSPEALSAVEVDASADTVSVHSTTKKRRWLGASVDTTVILPAGSSVAVRSGVGDVVVGLDVRELEVHTGSGDVRADVVSGVCDIKIGSGDVRLRRLEGASRISSGAGDVRVDWTSEMTINTAAGDIHLGEVTESARIKSATGDVRVRKFAGSDLEIKTMSGDVTVGLVTGMVVDAAIKTLSGDLRNRIKPSAGEKIGRMNLRITSLAGDVILKSAK